MSFFVLLGMLWLASNQLEHFLFNENDSYHLLFQDLRTLTDDQFRLNCDVFWFHCFVF